MRKIAVINQKGGVGKTTTTANLGAALAKAGKRVLLADLDPQGHLSLHYGLEITDEQLSMYDVLTDDVPLLDVIQKVRDGIAIAPADIHLAGAEAELVSVMGREVIFREALAPLEADHDYLLIDCPPSVGVLTVNALAAVDEVLIPLQAQFFALQGFAKLLEKTVTLVHKRINPSLTVAGVILCMHEPATRLAGEVVDDLASFLEAGRDLPVPWAKARLFDSHIRRNIKLAEACSFGETIFDYAPRSNGANDYLSLADEIFPEAGIELPSWLRRKRTGRAPSGGAGASVSSPQSNGRMAGMESSAATGTGGTAAESTRKISTGTDSAGLSSNGRVATSAVGASSVSQGSVSPDPEPQRLEEQRLEVQGSEVQGSEVRGPDGSSSLSPAANSAIDGAPSPVGDAVSLAFTPPEINGAAAGGQGGHGVLKRTMPVIDARSMLNDPSHPG